MKFLVNAISGVGNVGTEATIDYAKFFEICQKRNRGLRTAISVTINLKTIVRRFESGGWTLSLDEETLLAKVGREEKCVIGLFDALGDRDISLDLYFLFVWIGLVVVLYVPSERDEKFVDEIRPRRALVIVRLVIFVVIVRKRLYELENFGVGYVEIVGNHNVSRR